MQERKPKRDEGDYLILGVILGIFGTAIYDMGKGLVAQFLPSLSTFWDDSLGAYLAVGVLWFGYSRRRKRKEKESKDAGT